MSRMLKLKIIAVGLIGGFALGASANLLNNGSFETQSPVTNKPAGWATTLDGTYWLGNTKSGATNMVFRVSTFAGVDGDYYIRKQSFSGTPVGTSVFSSVSYNLSALSLLEGTTDLVLSLQTTDTSSTADTGKLATYGSLVFYSGINGTGSVLGTYETSRLVSSTATSWVNLSVTSAIPVSALSFKVNANVAFYQATTATYAGQRFDGFSVTAIPEPATVSMFLLSGAGLLAIRRRFLS